MSPELILVPRAFIILVSVGDRSPTLTRTIEALGTRIESRAQRNDKRIHGCEDETAEFYFLFYNFATQMKLLWRGNLREAELMRNRDFPQFLTKTEENSRNHPPGSQKLLRNKQPFWRKLQEIIEMNNQSLLALIESWNNWESLKTVRVKVFCSISTSTLLFHYEFWPTFQYFEPILEFNFWIHLNSTLLKLFLLTWYIFQAKPELLLI